MLIATACGGNGGTPREALRAKLLAAAPAGTKALLVDVYGPGHGTIDSPDAALQCDGGAGLCWAYPADGSPLTLAATPDASSVFVSWGGNCSGNGACRLTANAVHEVSAVFQPHTVTVVLDGAGQGAITSDAGTPSCSGTACTLALSSAAPATVTLSATASDGSYFAGWWGEGCSGTAPCAVTADRARTIHAAFQPNGTAVNVWAPAGGGGTVAATGTAEPSCALGRGTTSCTLHVDTTKLPQGVTLTATPDATSVFAGWGGACSGTGACRLTVSGPASVTAIFQPHTFAVALNGAGEGTVTATPDLGLSCSSGTCQATLSGAASATVTLTATASPGSFFAGWWGEGCSGTAPCQVTTGVPRHVTATFQPNTFGIAVAALGTGSGSVSVAGTTCALGGAARTCAIPVPNTTPAAQVTLTAAADAGSTFAGWSGACGGRGTCQLTVSQPMTVSAIFQAAGGSTGGPGAPVGLAFDVQPSSGLAGASLGVVTVGARDAQGNAVSPPEPVTVSLAAAPGVQLLGTTTAAAAGTGATFPDLAIRQAGTYVLRATSGTLTVDSATLTVSAGAPAALRFTVEPSAVVAAQVMTPAVQVSVIDAFGNVVEAGSPSITLALEGGAGAALAGTQTAAAVLGTASFVDLSVDSAGTYALLASASGLTSATSASFAVSGAAPARLEFGACAAALIAGATLPDVTVYARDPVGNVVAPPGPVTLSLAAAPAGGALLGTTTASPVGPVATFSGLALQTVGTYVLHAASLGLAADSGQISVTPAAPSSLAFTVQPSSAVAGQLMAPVQVAVRDGFGNLVAPGSTLVALRLQGGAPGAALGGTVSAVASSGVASFGDLVVDTAGSGYTLAASAAGLPEVASAPFTVAAPTPPLAVAAITPADGAVITSTATPVAVTFSRAIDPATLTVNTDTSCSGSLQLSATGFSSCVPFVAAATPSAGNATFAATPRWPSQTGVTYQLRITTAVRDAGGVPMNAGFVTVSGIQLAAVPRLVAAMTPAAGSEGQSAATPVTILFDQDASFGEGTTDACAGAVQLVDASGACVPLSRIELTGARTAVAQPAQPLQYGSSYTAKVAANAFVTSSGAPLAADLAQTFRTEVPPSSAYAPAVISALYGSGGSNGGYAYDYVELHNRSSDPMDLAGYGLWYASANGTTWLRIDAGLPVLPAGSYYLLRLASSPPSKGTPFVADATSTVNISGTSGKVVLAPVASPPTGGCPSASLDLVGYGTTTCHEGTAEAPSPSQTTSLVRAANGCQDSGQNSSDWARGTTAPRNSASAPLTCGLSPTRAVNETGTSAEVNYCTVQRPTGTIAVARGAVTETIYGQVFEAGTTPSTGGAAIVAHLGYGPAGVDPTSALGWQWFSASFNTSSGSNDEYLGGLTAPSVAGSYRYGYRFSLDGGGTWTYCDVDGAGSNLGADFSVGSLPALEVQ